MKPSWRKRMVRSLVFVLTLWTLPATAPGQSHEI